MTGDRKGLKVDEAAAIEQVLLEFEGRTAPRPTTLIPLLGYAAAGGGDRIAWALDRPLDWVEAPPIRDSDVEVVAIRVAGDSMEPRLFSGEMIYVGLNLAPARGGDCVIEFRDETALVKSYYGRKDQMIFAHQYNPEEQLKFPESSVKGLHAVLWRR